MKVSIGFPAVVVLWILFVAPVMAEDFDIPAGPLEQTLNAYSEITGKKAVYLNDLVKGKVCSALNGTYSHKEALDKILKGTGLTFTVPDEDTMILKEGRSVVVHPKKVLAQKGNAGTGENVATKTPAKESEPVASDPTNIANLVVTASRTLTKKAELPQSISVVSQTDMEYTVDPFSSAIGALKHNTMIDIWEGPNSNGRIGMRGFAPEFGPNARTLFLVDGLPVGGRIVDTTMDNIERIEVLKGPASALYGSGAMGGVVNAISKQSRGEIKTALSLGGGSFDAWNAKAASGGNLNDIFDFDLNLATRHQNDDFRRGNGDEWSPTTYNKNYGNVRLGGLFFDNWRLDLKGNWFDGRDMGENASRYKGPDIYLNNDLTRYGGNLRLSGMIGQSNELSLALYTTQDEFQRNQVDPGQAPFIEAEMTNQYTGGNIQNTTFFGDHHLIIGTDYRVVESDWKYWSAEGVRKRPWCPNSQETSLGFYSEAMLRFFENRLILTLGGRYDRIELETKETPLVDGLVTGTEDFSTTNPSAGMKFFITSEWQLHTSYGRAFVAPQARQMSGTFGYLRSDGLHLYYGNSDLKPERSQSWDGGLSFAKKNWGLFSDLTYFMTDVDNKIATVDLGPLEHSYVNSQEAEIRGLEGELSLDLGHLFNWESSLRLYSMFSKLFKSEEKFATSTQDTYNVADLKILYGLHYDDGHFFSGRVSGRYVGDRKVKATTLSPVDTLPSFNVFDVSADFRIMKHHRLGLQVGNLFDKEYSENQYSPMPGRTFYAEYTFAF